MNSAICSTTELPDIAVPRLAWYRQLDGAEVDELGGRQSETVQRVRAAEDVIDECRGQEVIHPPARVACLARHPHVRFTVP